jgi:hypothetical protein
MPTLWLRLNNLPGSGNKKFQTGYNFNESIVPPGERPLLRRRIRLPAGFCPLKNKEYTT